MASSATTATNRIVLRILPHPLGEASPLPVGERVPSDANELLIGAGAALGLMGVQSQVSETAGSPRCAGSRCALMTRRLRGQVTRCRWRGGGMDCSGSRPRPSWGQPLKPTHRTAAGRCNVINTV